MKQEGNDGQTAWYTRVAAIVNNSLYQDCWDRHGLNSKCRRADVKLRAYSRLPMRAKLVRPPVVSAAVATRLLRRRLKGELGQ